MSAKVIGVLIFIPVIPALPVMMTWFLPWERWIPRKVPKMVIGPYLLYCSFVTWHFGGSWWLVVLVAVCGTVVSATAVFDTKRVKQSRDWPIAVGRVLHIGESRDDDGFLNVTITYTYKVQDER